MNFELLSIKSELQKAFSDLVFEEYRHIYHLDGQKLPSVSSQIKKFHEPFDTSIAKWVAKKEGVTEQEILKKWELKRTQSQEFGTKTHLFGEEFVLGCAKPTNSAELGICQWWIEKPSTWEPIALELPVYYKNYAGTPDIILYDTENKKFIIADYKTNEDLFKNYKDKKLYTPFDDLLENPINKYSIQLSLYQMCLESKGFPVSHRIIIWLRVGEDCSFYQQFFTDDLTDKLKKYYGDNS